MSGKNTVCVVSSDNGLPNSLKSSFKAAGLTIVGYTSITDFIDSIDPDKPVGCVVSELSRGLELLRDLSENQILVPVVLVAGGGNNTVATVQAIKAGAFDVLDKPDGAAESAKKAAAYAARCQKLLEEKQIAAERIHSLTKREAQVLNLMVEGKPNREIAAELGISTKTLDIHRANLMAKLEARTTATVANTINLILFAESAGA